MLRLKLPPSSIRRDRLSGYGLFCSDGQAKRLLYLSRLFNHRVAPLASRAIESNERISVTSRNPFPLTTRRDDTPWPPRSAAIGFPSLNQSRDADNIRTRCHMSNDVTNKTTACTCGSLKTSETLNGTLRQHLFSYTCTQTKSSISDLYPLFPLSSCAHHLSSGLECLSWLRAIWTELAITWIHDSLRDIGSVLSTVASRRAGEVRAFKQRISGRMNYGCRWRLVAMVQNRHG